MRVLVVEDDPSIVLFVEESLRDAGYGVTIARDGASGLLDAQLNAYSVIILDLMLPGIDGLEVIRRLRASHIVTPILVLTARDREPDKITGLDIGADDYLTKPFRIGELRARIRALLRRESLCRTSVMHIGDLELDTATRRVRRASREISLSAREYSLMQHFVHHAGQVLTRDQLEQAVWGESGVGSNVVEVYVGYLRQKIDVPFSDPLIHTVRGVGYTLRAPSNSYVTARQVM